MTLAVSQLYAASTSTSQNSFTTGSFTPTANAKIYASCWSENTGGALTIADTAGLTWTEVDTGGHGPFGAFGARLYVWEATAGSSPASMTITFSSFNTFFAPDIIQVTGNSPQVKSGQHVIALAFGPTYTTGTLPSAATSGNLCVIIGGGNRDTGLALFDPGAPWSVIGTNPTGGGNFEYPAAWSSTTFTGTSVSWNPLTGDSGDALGMLLMEIEEAGGGGGTQYAVTGTVAAVSGLVESSAAVYGVSSPKIHAVSGLTESAAALHPLTGSCAAVSGTSGSVGLGLPVTGSTAVVSGTSGSVSARLVETGTTAGTSGLTDAATAIHPLTGSTAGVSATSGTPTALHPLAGSAAGVSGLTDAATATHPFSGTVAAVSGCSGSVTVPGSGGVSGTVVCASGTSGNPTATHPMSGSTAAVSGLTEAAAGLHPLTGSCAAVSGETGSVNVASPLTGSCGVVSAVTGSVAALLAEVGTVIAISGTLGTPVALHPLSGSTAAVTTTSGTPLAVLQLTGAVVVVSATTGAISIVGEGFDFTVISIVELPQRSVGVVASQHTVAEVEQQREVAAVGGSRTIEVTEREAHHVSASQRQ